MAAATAEEVKTSSSNSCYKAPLARVTAIISWFLLLVVNVNSQALNNNSSNSNNKLAFGSCSKQYLPQSFWPTISNLKPGGWLWTGDAVYTNCSAPQCIKEAYEMLENSHDYQQFRRVLPFIDGTWDDHDYGVNDGGKDYTHKQESAELFLDFLGVAKNSPRRSRDGIYGSRLFPIYSKAAEASQQQPDAFVKLVLLDSRSQREQPYVKSLSEDAVIPCSSIIAALLRMLTTSLGLGWNHSSDVLGENQWRWLEDELLPKEEEKVVATVIVSSVQVMTTVSLFESWGHFPQSKRRLYKLIQKTKPPGLVFLSGDVHMGQLSGEPDCVLEFTSSGLTHSSMSNKVSGLILAHVILPISQTKFNSPHKPNLEVDKDNRQYYNRPNFGTLQFVYDKRDNESVLSLIGTVHDINGEPKLRAVQQLNQTADYLCLDQLPALVPQRSTMGFIFLIFVQLLFFIALLAPVFLTIWICVGLIRRLIKVRREPICAESQHAKIR